jgi:hypothetical protein
MEQFQVGGLLSGRHGNQNPVTETGDGSYGIASVIARLAPMWDQHNSQRNKQTVVGNVSHGDDGNNKSETPSSNKSLDHHGVTGNDSEIAPVDGKKLSTREGYQLWKEMLKKRKRIGDEGSDEG